MAVSTLPDEFDIAESVAISSLHLRGESKASRREMHGQARKGEVTQGTGNQSISVLSCLKFLR